MKGAKLAVVLLLLAMIAIALSCKKNKGVQPISNLKIAYVDKYHAGSVLHYRFVYDSYNNVDSTIIVGGGTDTGTTNFMAFMYYGSFFSITTAYNGAYDVDVNSNNLISEVPLYDTLLMTYNNNELTEQDIKSPITTPPYYSIAATDYTWANGDIASYTNQGISYTLDYNQSRPGQLGDGWRIDLFLSYGTSYIQTTHLPTDIMNGAAWVEKYFYQFDGQGRISQFIRTQNNNGSGADDTTIYNYQYDY